VSFFWRHQTQIPVSGRELNLLDANIRELPPPTLEKTLP